MFFESQFLRRVDICRRYHISPSTFDRLRKRGRFPEPVQISDRIFAWPATEVDAAMRANRSSQLPLPHLALQEGKQ